MILMNVKKGYKFVVHDQEECESKGDTSVCIDLKVCIQGSHSGVHNLEECESKGNNP